MKNIITKNEGLRILCRLSGLVMLTIGAFVVAANAVVRSPEIEVIPAGRYDVLGLTAGGVTIAIAFIAWLVAPAERNRRSGLITRVFKRVWRIVFSMLLLTSVAICIESMLIHFDLLSFADVAIVALPDAYGLTIGVLSLFAGLVVFACAKPPSFGVPMGRLTVRPWGFIGRLISYKRILKIFGFESFQTLDEDDDIFGVIVECSNATSNRPFPWKARRLMMLVKRKCEQGSGVVNWLKKRMGLDSSQSISMFAKDAEKKDWTPRLDLWLVLAKSNTIQRFRPKVRAAGVFILVALATGIAMCDQPLWAILVSVSAVGFVFISQPRTRKEFRFVIHMKTTISGSTNSVSDAEDDDIADEDNDEEVVGEDEESDATEDTAEKDSDDASGADQSDGSADVQFSARNKIQEQEFDISARRIPAACERAWKYGLGTLYRVHYQDDVIRLRQTSRGKCLAILGIGHEWVVQDGTGERNAIARLWQPWLAVLVRPFGPRWWNCDVYCPIKQEGLVNVVLLMTTFLERNNRYWNRMIAKSKLSDGN